MREPDEWDELTEGQHEEYRRIARAVIAAIREPSKEITLAALARAGTDEAYHVGDFQEVFAAMIDKMLEEG